MDRFAFVFVTCQVGAEAALKQELSRQWLGWRLAFSRPGFLTFKLPAQPVLAADFDLRSVFARAYGFSLGQAEGADDRQRAEAVWRLAAQLGPAAVDRLHVWSRDRDEPGRWGYEPRPTPDDEQVRSALLAAMPPNTAAETLLAAQRAPAATDLPAPPIHHPDAMRTAPTAVGHRVLDCILVERDQWWVGHHVVRQIPSRWPGGLFHCPLPPEAVSRTYLKMREALAWSQLPVRAGDRFVEIGSAPGGASQALLELGLHVIGIDPADMAPQVLAHPSFEHWKMRGSDVRRRRFRGVRWLAADINVAPCYTLDMVEDIVTHPAVEIHGLLLTLKLLDWSLADDIPEHLARVRSWGFARVKARQLHHNRQEFCVAALRQPTRRRRR